MVWHTNVMTAADDPDAEINKAEWNAAHLIVPISITLFLESSGAVNFTGAAAYAELNVPRVRSRADLTYATQARVVVGQAGVASGVGSAAEVRIEYSANSGSTWNYLDHSAGPAAVLFQGTDEFIIVEGSWVNINAAAKGDVWLRGVFGGYAGAAGASIYRVELQVR